MSNRTFGARPSRFSAAAGAALDRGLSVRVPSASEQRPLFAGNADTSLQQQALELAGMVASLRVRSFRLRSELEQITGAMLYNIECGFWIYARRAARDLAGLLGMVMQSRTANVKLYLRCVELALDVGDLCVTEACRGAGAAVEASARCFSKEVR